ncbi:MAG: CBS domain-containing protein, partial [Acidimicrobiales bacterium]
TGNFALILPVMLVVGIAAAVSRRCSYGSIYTTKLLRRGIDLDAPTASTLLSTVTVSEVMQPSPTSIALRPPDEATAELSPSDDGWSELGSVSARFRPQALLADETLEQALRQLALYGRVGLPVLSAEREHLLGWITRQDVLRAMAQHLGSAQRKVDAGVAATEFVDPRSVARRGPTSPLDGYELVELAVAPGSRSCGQRIDELALPEASMVVAVTTIEGIVTAKPDVRVAAGQHLVVLAPLRHDEDEDEAEESDEAEAEDEDGESDEAEMAEVDPGSPPAPPPPDLDTSPTQQ